MFGDCLLLKNVADINISYLKHQTKPECLGKGNGRNRGFGLKAWNAESGFRILRSGLWFGIRI